jgi:hypothetical protein
MLLFFSLRIAGNSIWVHFWVHLRNMGAAKGLGALIPLRPSQRPCLLQRLFACEDLRPQMRFGMITFGEMRSSGVRDVLIYCRDHRCSHHVEVNADGWPDDMQRLRQERR